MCPRGCEIPQKLLTVPSSSSDEFVSLESIVRSAVAVFLCFGNREQRLVGVFLAHLCGKWYKQECNSEETNWEPDPKLILIFSDSCFLSVSRTGETQLHKVLDRL